LRFPGQYFDEETGLHYNWNRYYDPAIGRYLRLDPAEDGLNLYVYAGNNPNVFIDPEGLVARGATKAVNQAVDDISRLYDNGPVLAKGVLVLARASVEIPTSAASSLTRIALGTKRVWDSLGATKRTTALQKFFPVSEGFLGKTQRKYLMLGQKIDRYGGSDYSRFFSPQGTPKGARALPPETVKQPLRIFEVKKPFEVKSGTVAPAFGELGLGTQYRTLVRMGTLIKRGIIREVK